jgi:nitrite reductase (NADH) large subunit
LVDSKNIQEGARSPRVVVVGNGMAGLAAVEAVLKLKPEAAITIFGDEPHLSYNRILLSDLLAGKTAAGKLVMNSKEWYTACGIDLKLGNPVSAIDPEGRVITDRSGKTTFYDALILAVGGVPFVPPILGREKKGVFVFRTLEETQQILTAARSSREAVVVGGGLLGLEAARGLINYGVSVTVVHLADRLMEQQLDPVGASLLKREMTRMGIRVILEETVEEILGEEQVSGVRLKGGKELPAQMVVICTGIRPNLSLAEKTGLKVGRGIVVDDRLETSVPGIFAVGDVIEHRGKTYGLIAPLREQAAVVADQIAGAGKTRYQGTICATTLKVAGVHLTSAGDLIGGGGAEEVAFLDTQKSIYKKCIIRQDRLVGFILLGENKEGPRLFNLIQKGEPLREGKAGILGNVDLEEGKSAAAVAVKDSDLVCNCNSVTRGEIVCAIREKGLKERDEVAACTKATTGCGSCAQLVDDLLNEVNRPAVKPLTPVLVAQEKQGATALKTLDLEKVKQEGLGIDFVRLKEMGTRALAPEDYYRLKTYGFCTQKHPGYFMLRIRIPGGKLSSRQLRYLADLAEEHGRGLAHLTVRQSIELHWVRVEEALEIFHKLEEIGLTTRSACGHTMRNVTACPHGAIAPEGKVDVQPWAERITDYFVKRSDLINPAMPNRLNISFAACAECAPDAAINDIGFVTVDRLADDGRRELGFELWVGGSLGAHPILGFKLRDFIPLSDALPACQAIFSIHMKFGNRNKAKSRLKYLIEQWGHKKFTEMFEKVFLEKRNLPENETFPLPPQREREIGPGPVGRFLAAVTAPGLFPLPPGASAQRQKGFLRLTVGVPLGELRAEQLSVLGRIARRYGDGEVHLTQEQEIELHWVPALNAGGVIRALRRMGLSLKGEKSGLNLLACPGTEFCALAVTNAQGTARELLKHFRPDESEKAALLKSVSIHISGCPNSCAKHQIADIGLAGTLVALGELRRFSYQLYLGGEITEAGIRLGEMVRKGITEEMVVPTVEALLNIVLAHRIAGEPFQETVGRLGTKKLSALLESEIAPFLPHESESITMIHNLVEVP